MRTILRMLVLMCLLCLARGPAIAVPPTPAPDPRIDALDFLVGEWRGSGWIVLRDGERHAFSSTEVVRRRLQGTALLVEGSHTGFEAMAVVTFDAKASQYRWRSFTSRGPGVDAEAKLVAERTLQWFPSATARYTIVVDRTGVWNETGEFTHDGGKTWTQFFAMTLQRVDAAPSDPGS